MKLIIRNNLIVGTGNDNFSGPDLFITAPDDYDPNIIYDVVDGKIVERVSSTPDSTPATS